MGFTVGDIDGESVGLHVGANEGNIVGIVGLSVGDGVGLDVGANVGHDVYSGC